MHISENRERYIRHTIDNPDGTKDYFVADIVNSFGQVQEHQLDLLSHEQVIDQVNRGIVFRVTDQSGPRLRVDLTTEADGIETNNLSFEDTSDLDDLSREYISINADYTT